MHSGSYDHEHWSSRLAFIMAAVGAAVGLGNLWRFPYEAGANGGGAFVLVYMICVLLIGLPVLAAELFIGRRGALSAVGSVSKLARDEGRSPAWAALSWIGMIGAFLILTFYSVIAGWVIAYVVMFVGDFFAQVGASGPAALAGGAFASETPGAVSARLGELLGDPGRMTFYHSIFMVITVLIVARGLKGGIETAVQVMMPAFFFMLLVLVGYSFAAGDIGRAANFLLFDFEITALMDGEVILSALGQAFFSIGLGAALMITYGAYMTKDVNIPRASGIIAVADTLVALIAGFAIFPIVFAVGLDPAAGPTLLFESLPLAFQSMPFGLVFGLVFFVLAFFAALTSSISLLEIAASWLEEQTDMPRALLVSILGGIAFIVGLGSVFSMNIWSAVKPISFIPLFEGKTIFDILDVLTGQVLLPLSGFLTAVFAGWVVSERAAAEELGFKSETYFKAWRFSVRYICPVAVGAVLVYGALIAPLLD
ncbi:MAG: sodium-dependent transporter [Pseudomonadota bacterium]